MKLLRIGKFQINVYCQNGLKNIFIRVYFPKKDGLHVKMFRPFNPYPIYFGYWCEVPEIPNGVEIFKDTRFIYKNNIDPLNILDKGFWSLGFKFTTKELENLKLIEGK